MDFHGLDHNLAEDIHAAIKSLYQAGACPHTAVVDTTGDPELEPWKTLLESGFVQRFKGGLQISERGRQSLQVNVAVRTKQPVFAIRQHLALEDRTPFELALTLRERGFTWRPMPSQKQVRVSLVHTIGDADPDKRVWYSMSANLVPAYLLCILKGDVLQQQFGIAEFPHYSLSPVLDFQRILDKGEVFQPPAIEPAVPRRPALMGMDDGELAPDIPAQIPALQDAPEEDLSLADLHGHGDEAEEETLEEAMSRGIAAFLKESEVEDVDDDGDSGGDSGEGRSDQEGGEEKPMDDVEPPPPPAPDPGSSAGRRHLKKIMWGPCFVIALKKTRGKADAYEARCPFHWKSGTTGCKKTFDLRFIIPRKMLTLS